MSSRGAWRFELPAPTPARRKTTAAGPPGAIDTAAGPPGAIDTAAGPPGAIDVEVDLPDGTTVAELAGALAAHIGWTGGSTDLTVAVDGSALDPRVAARTAAPRNGSTLRLCQEDRDAIGPPPAAPVRLRRGSATQRLNYGNNQLGSGVSVRVGHGVVVTDDGSGVLTLNGVGVRGNAVATNGDLLRVGTFTATIEIAAVLRPPPDGGPTARVPVSRGTWEPHESDPVELPRPPGRFRRPGFPWLTALVPLLMAAGAWMATRSLLMVAFMGFSFVYVLASGIESRIESKAADRFAVREFREELAEVERDLEVRRDSQSQRDELHHPWVREATGWASPLSHRLWERSGSHPNPLVVRLGTAPGPPDDPVIRPERGRPDLRAELDDACSHNEPSPRPVTVDLAATGGIALVGDDTRSIALASSLAAQLAVLVPPGELALRATPAVRGWDWVRWVPHTSTPASFTVSLQRRDAENPLGNAQRSRSDGADDGPVIWSAADTVELSESIRALVHFDNHGLATLQLDHAEPLEFTPETMSEESLEMCARHLAGYEPGNPGSAVGDSTPRSVTLADLGLRAEAEHISKRWEEQSRSRADNSLSFCLGAVSGGGVLVIDLVRDGPHALVAGTTGAGKSELLRTMLLGLTARLPPDRLNVFLIDYKGGAAFGPLAELPHCVGMLTDLRGDAAVRTLTALRAELRRRETVLEEHRASDVSDLDSAMRPASLVLVVDEFATLVSEVPDFLDGVLDVAQRGRSLGIHLVLATQRPSGVISDSIRANTSLRIALRLPDVDDSTDVIDSPHAAGLARDLPGRAFVRLGHDQLVSTQVAYGGTVPTARPEVRVMPLGGSTTAPPSRATGSGSSETGASESSASESGASESGGRESCGATEMELLVEAIREADSSTGHRETLRPVPPPLPETLNVSDLPAPSSAEGLCLGLVDVPEYQRTELLRIDPTRLGGVLVLGAPSSGVSTALAALADAADRQGGWEVRAIDANGGLGMLGSNPSVREIVDATDHEPLRRMLGTLGADASAPPRTRRLLLVDGFGIFEQTQESVNRGWATDALIDLAANGRRNGLLVAVAARRRMEVPPGLLHHLGERIVLRAIDEDEATMMDAPAELARVDLPAGRAWVRGHWAQLVQPSSASRGSQAASTGPPDLEPSIAPRRLERDVAIAPLTNAAAVTQSECDDPAGTDPWRLPIGIDSRDLDTAVLDLSTTHALVSGAPGTGRTTTLATIATSALSRGITVIGASASSGGSGSCGSSEVASALATAAQSTHERPEVPVLVLLEDLDRHVEDPQFADTLAVLSGDVRGSNLRIVASADPLGLLRCYDDAVLRLRSMRTGMLLGADSHEIGDVLHHDLRRREDIPPAPGRGWLCHRGGASVVQVAH